MHCMGLAGSLRHCDCGLIVARLRATETRDVGCYRGVFRALSIHMTFEQLGYFLALAEERSFVRAARRCGISQPSLTNAVKSLEAALGAPLFERTVKGSKLTAFGKQMHPYLAQLHHDKLQVLELAHTVSCASNPLPPTRIACFGRSA